MSNSLKNKKEEALGSSSSDPSLPDNPHEGIDDPADPVIEYIWPNDNKIATISELYNNWVQQGTEDAKDPGYEIDQDYDRFLG